MYFDIHLSHNFTSFTLLYLYPFCFLNLWFKYIDGPEAIHWSVFNLSGTRPLKLILPPPIANSSSGIELMSLSHLLLDPCIGTNTYYEFMRSVVLSCLENTVFLWSSNTAAIIIFLPTLLLPNLTPRRQDVVIDVLFVADHFLDFGLWSVVSFWVNHCPPHKENFSDDVWEVH